MAFNVIANYMRGPREADISNNEILALFFFVFLTTFVCACISKPDLSVMHVKLYSSTDTATDPTQV